MVAFLGEGFLRRLKAENVRGDINYDEIGMSPYDGTVTREESSYDFTWYSLTLLSGQSTPTKESAGYHIGAPPEPPDAQLV